MSNFCQSISYFGNNTLAHTIWWAPKVLNKWSVLTFKITTKPLVLHNHYWCKLSRHSQREVRKIFMQLIFLGQILEQVSFLVLSSCKNLGKNCTFLRWLPFVSPFLSSACPGSVLELSSYVLFRFLCPWNVLLSPLFCPVLALESAQNLFDVLSMTYFPQMAFGWTLESVRKGYLWSSSSPPFMSGDGGPS